MQEATLPLIRKGNNVMAMARIGTGKTGQFMISTINDIVVKSFLVDRDQTVVLVICLTQAIARHTAALRRQQCF